MWYEPKLKMREKSMNLIYYIYTCLPSKPKDMAAINERRKEFNQNNNQAMQSNQRYHADEVEERFAKYKPGVMR